MKNLSLMAMTLALTLGSLSGCSDREASQTVLDPNSPIIAMSELVKNAQPYTGKTVTVTGRFGGMCADGEDFYFKDKLVMIEVFPPAEGMPSDITIGTPLKVQGVVLVQNEHHNEGDESEPEVKIQATVIQTNRS